jgi:Predicted membrane protein (DUF2306)
MASSRRNLRMRNLSFGKASTTTAEILSPPFQMSKQPTRRIFALSSELGTSSLGSSVSRPSGPVPKGMLHVWSLAQFTSSATALARRGSRIPPSFGGSCRCPRSVSWSTRPAFSWLRRATSISRATFFLFACILPEAWARFWRALGSFPKSESTGAEPAPLARSLLLIGSRARLSRRLRHGSGIGTRSRHTLGFGILAVMWFLTGLEAYRTVSRGNIEAQRRRMIRNFALTLAAVIPRNQLPFMRFALDWPFPRSYITVSWLCWVPNLLIAEWMVRRRKPPSLSQSDR